MVVEKNKSISQIGSGNLPYPQWLYTNFHISGTKFCGFVGGLLVQEMTPPCLYTQDSGPIKWARGNFESLSPHEGSRSWCFVLQWRGRCRVRSSSLWCAAHITQFIRPPSRRCPRSRRGSPCTWVGRPWSRRQTTGSSSAWWVPTWRFQWSRRRCRAGRPTSPGRRWSRSHSTLRSSGGWSCFSCRRQPQ